MRNEPLPVRAGPGLLLMLAVVLLTATGKQILYDSMDPDAFWHLRVADQLLRDGVGPLVDDLSFASQKEPWTPYSWAAELFMRQVWQIGGYHAAVLVQAMSTAAILTFIALACLSARPSSRLAVVVACVFTAFLSLPFLSFRPVTLCFVLIAAARWLMERDRRAWWIVPLCLLGANVHFFIWIVPAWLICKLIDRWRSSDVTRIDLLHLSAVIVACACTPMLPGVIAQVVQYQVGDVMVDANVIAEFQPLWSGTMGMIATAMVVAMLAGACWASRQTPSPGNPGEGRGEGQNRSVRQNTALTLPSPGVPGEGTTQTRSPGGASITLGDCLMLLGATLLLLKMSRFAPIFAIVAAPMLARILPTMSDRLLDRRPMLYGLATFALLLAGRVAFEFPRAGMSFDTWVNRHLPDGGGYPTAAASFVETQVAPVHGRLINEFTWGGYLGWRFNGGFQTLIDGRTQVFAPSLWQTLYLQDDASRASYLSGVRADAAVLPVQRSKLASVLEGLGWRKIYADERAMVLIPPDAPIAQSSLPTE